MRYGPYMRLLGKKAEIPALPLSLEDLVKLSAVGAVVSQDIKEPSTYREFFTVLEGYASAGMSELRGLNPLTRGKPQDENLRDD